MIKIAFCDDNAETLNDLDNIMSEIAPSADWEVFHSGSELLHYIKMNHESFQIYILDIQMPEPDGIQTAKTIRQTDKNALILFLTDYKEYVYQVFEVLPFRFLQKPLDKVTLKRTLEQAAAHIQESRTLFFFKAGTQQMQLPFCEILCFEGAGRKIRIHTQETSISFYGKLKEIWEALDKNQFARPHASFLVNMEYIRIIRQEETILTGNLSIPVSKRYRSQFKLDHLKFTERRNGFQ